MLAPGWIKTARGLNLNLDELIGRSRAPINKGVDHKDKVARRTIPNPPVNIRGFTPRVGQAPSRIGPEVIEKEVKATPSSFTGKAVESLADLTGIKVDSPKYHKNKAKAENLEAATGAALGEVLGELKAVAKDTSEPENVP